MAELQPPIALQNVATLNADDFRQMIQALVPTEGVAGSGDLAVTQNGTPNMSVNVAAGRAFILGDNSATTQGMYVVSNDATVNKVIAASDPTNPRWDLVIAEVRDAFYSGSSNDWQIRVVTGTPAASPAEPALPNNAIKLARVVVGAAVTSITSANITDLRPRARQFPSSPPACRVANSAAISITTSGTPQALTFNTELFDTDSMHSTTTNTNRITINTAGMYVVYGMVEFAANANGFRQLYARKNGSVPFAISTQLPAVSAADTIHVSFSAVYKLAAGDYIECIARQTSGGALNVTSFADWTPQFGATWLGTGD